MDKSKESLVFGFAIFASFFGAGNLILPPFLGLTSGPDWWIVVLGFMVTAVIIPLLALIAHARLQGTMLDFGNKVSRIFSLLFCLSVYIIAITLPTPRTAAVTHEIAIQPFLGSSSIITSSIYFALVLIFAINRSQVLQILGKFLTPIIVFILLLIIGLGVFTSPPSINDSILESPAMIYGLLEGYQTYDALGGLLIGGVVIISLNLQGYTSFEAKKRLIVKSGIVAAVGLLIIYAGLTFVGALFNSEFASSITRTELLSSISSLTLGNIGTSFLSILVGLACFTTAVSIVVGTADFMKGIFNESRQIYTLTVVASCILGVLIGQFDVHYIIVVARPALMFIYPLTIVLILLNVLPEKYAAPYVFKVVVLVTFLFSIPDFLGFIVPAKGIEILQSFIPFGQYNLGWVLPALIAWATTNMVKR